MSRLRLFKLLWAGLFIWALLAIHHDWFRYRWTNSHLVREIGLVGYIIYDFVDFEWQRFDDIDDVDPAPFNAFLKARREAFPSPAKTPAQPKNVIFLQMESIDASVSTEEHDGEPTMPFFNALKRRAWWFKNVFDQTGMGRSADAHILVLMSQIPIQNQAIFTRYDLSKARSLPRILSARGYKTFSMEGYQGDFWRWKLNHKRLGYQTSFSMTELDNTDKLGWGVSDMSLVTQAVAKMPDNQPFLAHIVLLTNHHPFTFVREFEELPANGIVSDYLISCRYTDKVLRHLFDLLNTRGLLQDTLIAIYSDHDSGVVRELAEHFHEPFHEEASFERIPLVLWVGGESRVITHPAGLQDLAPTILTLLGLPVPRSFVGIPAQLDHGDVLLQNRTHIDTLTPDRQGIVKPLDLDIGTLTRLAIDRPDALLD